MGSVEVDSDETDVNTVCILFLLLHVVTMSLHSHVAMLSMLLQLLNSIFRQLGGQGQMQGSASGEGESAAGMLCKRQILRLCLLADVLREIKPFLQINKEQVKKLSSLLSRYTISPVMTCQCML